jgi:hypothetical protein
MYFTLYIHRQCSFSFFVLFDIRSSYVIQAGLELTGHSLACADPPATSPLLRHHSEHVCRGFTSLRNPGIVAGGREHTIAQEAGESGCGCGA